MADVLHRLGDISPERVRLRPFPASAADVVEIERCENRLFELVDGALVEKVMGHPESRLASAIIIALGKYLEENDIGTVSGEGGMFRLPDNLVRIPDVAFARWERFPDEESIEASVPEVTPDLAVEVLSEGNTRGEMSRKLREYFAAGVSLVWFVDPKAQSVTVYSSPTRSKVVPLEGTLDGGKVLPGFRLPVAKIFARLKRTRKGKRNGR
ncbi:MAG TPA: Uma2 family endonuclease [Pirellulaceae bacterium]|nr:Uma2 family endonuclease [Pirellulaceae bacterium]